jgi:hypothetical protein
VEGGRPLSRPFLVERGSGWAFWLDRGLLVASALAPACLAASHLGNAAEAADDRGVARVLGWDAQPWRSLDVAAGSLFAVVPVGSLVARAALGGAVVLAATGAVLFHVARELLGRAAGGAAPRIGPLVAAIATVSAGFAPSVQREATAPGGAVLGVLLVLAPLALLLQDAAVERAGDARRAGDAGRAGDAPAGGFRRAGWIGAALGLALGYEPLVALGALASSAAFVAVTALAEGRAEGAWRYRWRAFAWGAALGLAPFVVALVRLRLAGAPPQGVLAALAAGWARDSGAPPGGSAGGIASLGTALPVLAIGGSVLALLAGRARPVAAALLAVVAVGLGCAWAGVPAGPTRFGAPVLAGAAAVALLAGVAMQAIVRWVAETRLPFARGSAAMVVLLELVVPADEADESLLRGLSPTRAQAAALWDDLAWGVLPPRSVVLVTDERLIARAAAARAVGELRRDLAIVPAGPQSLSAATRWAAYRELASEPALVPLRRDLELAGAPTEGSLSSLAAARPVAMVYEPRWGRPIDRHLVPVALLDRFEPEPRGSSDRRHALEGFAPRRERLARLVGGDGDRGERDEWLADASAYVLRARALEVASSGDRDLVGRAVEDLHAFAPDDAVAAQIVARLALGRGPVRFDDLRP